MSAVAEHNPMVSDEMPPPLIFTDSAADKVARTGRRRRQSGPEAARVRAGRRLLGLPVRLHLRRGHQRRRHADGQERRHAADRRNEPAVPGRRRDRLQGRPAGRAVRHQESERHHHLRLRVAASRPDSGFTRHAKGCLRQPFVVVALAISPQGRARPARAGRAAPVTEGRLPGSALDECLRPARQRPAPRPAAAARLARAVVSTCARGSSAARRRIRCALSAPPPQTSSPRGCRRMPLQRVSRRACA